MQVVTGRARKITKKYIPGGPGDRAAKVGGSPKPPLCARGSGLRPAPSQTGKRAGGAFFLPEEKKKPKQSELCFGLARRKGLEPPTYWFVASHSIQLSYRRISSA